VWAPDSSLWVARAGGAPLEEVGSLDSSPVVIAISRAVADGLDAPVAALGAEADPGRPVKVIAIGPGPDADLAALEQVGAATGGAAHSAVDEQDLQTVLVDALRQRS
jgi:hypothetical protein